MTARFPYQNETYMQRIVQNTEVRPESFEKVLSNNTPQGLRPRTGCRSPRVQSQMSQPRVNRPVRKARAKNKPAVAY